MGDQWDKCKAESKDPSCLSFDWIARKVDPGLKAYNRPIIPAFATILLILAVVGGAFVLQYTKETPVRVMMSQDEVEKFLTESYKPKCVEWTAFVSVVSNAATQKITGGTETGPGLTSLVSCYYDEKTAWFPGYCEDSKYDWKKEKERAEQEGLNKHCDYKTGGHSNSRDNNGLPTSYLVYVDLNHKPEILTALGAALGVFSILLRIQTNTSFFRFH